MANVLPSTEALDDAGTWTASSLVLTANTQGAPTFAGPAAGMADTVDDNSAATGLLTANYVDIVADTSDWIGSVFIRKDAVTDRWPDVFTQFQGGAVGFVNLNTATGAIANGATAPAASGIVDVDAFWWRLWMRVTNTGMDTIRMGVYPSHLDGLGGSVGGGFTGAVTLWGFNVTNTSTLQPYEPQPWYSMVRGPATRTRFPKAPWLEGAA